MSTLAARNVTRSDADVIADIASGHLDGLAVLFDRYEQDTRRLITRLGVMAGDVDDLIQLTFLTVTRASKTYDGRCTARAWILGIAVMMVRRHRRSVARALHRAAEWFARTPPPPSETPDEELQAKESRLRLELALEAMSEKKREAFLLVAVEGLSGEEAAAALGIPVATVWTRLHHARQEIRKHLEEAP